MNKKISLIIKMTALACISCMLLCYQLWLNERNFPLSPVFDFLPAIPFPFDIIILGLFIITTLLSVIIPQQKIIISILILGIYLAINDINRWQPWFYQYMIMFFILSFYNSKNKNEQHSSAIILSFKLMIASIYIWSGLQKLNPHFVFDTFPWLMEPFFHMFGYSIMKYINWLSHAFPLIETVTGILLLLNKFQKVGATLAILMHLFILFVLSPFGQNYNPVVWPWNIFMIAINIILFYKSTSITKNDFIQLKKYYSLLFVIILFCLMPLLNFFNKWDSYLSHNLYSGNTSNGLVFVSDSVKQNLPEHIKQYVSEPDNELNIKYWCMMELGVPAYPEKRNFQYVTNTLYKYANDSSEIYLEYTPKIKVEM